MPEYSFVAPDGVTIIPDTYDLGRSCALTVTVPGQSEPVYIVNEMNKRQYNFCWCGWPFDRTRNNMSLWPIQ